MRKLFTVLATAGMLMAGSLIWKAEATPMTGIGSLPKLTKPIENVYYSRRGYYGWRRPYYGYGYRRPYYGGYGYGWRRPYYGGYGYGWRRPYYGGYGYRRWRY